MGYYIVGLLKSKTNLVEGYILLDSANNDKITLASRDNLIANMRKNSELIVNAKLTGRGVSGKYYSLGDLSSIIVTDKKRRIDDKGVLAVYSVDMNGSPSGIGYKCFRLRLDPMKSDIGIAARESLLNPGVQLINKIKGTIYTGCDANVDYRTGAVLQSAVIQGVAGIEKKVQEKNQSKLDEQTDTNDDKLDRMLDKLRPGLEQGGRHYTRDELLKALNDKMLNPYVDVTYDEFNFYMLINGWKYRASYAAADMSCGIRILEIDPKCKVLHLPENTVKFSLLESYNADEPMNRTLDFLYINNDKVCSVELPNGSEAMNKSSLTIGVLAFGGEKVCYNQVDMHSEITGSNLGCLNIGKLIIPNIKELMNISGPGTIGEVDLSNVEIFERCFNSIRFNKVPMLGSSIKRIRSSFNESNILEGQDLSTMTNIVSIYNAFNGVKNTTDTISLNSSVLYSIERSFHYLPNVVKINMQNCTGIGRISNSFNECNISTIELPNISEEAAKSDTRENLALDSSFNDVVCTYIRLPRTTTRIEDCFANAKQDINIEIYPYTVNYDEHKKQYSNNVGIDYLKGFKPNFKFTIENFNLPNSYFPIAKECLSRFSRHSEDDKVKFIGMDAKEIFPKNSRFHAMALSGLGLGIFDTGDFDDLTKIIGSFFGSSGKHDVSNRCYIETIVINKNIVEIAEDGFAGITGVRNIYINPEIMDIDPRAFTKHYINSVCNVYTTVKSPVCKMLRNKKGFNLVLVDNFDEAVRNLKEDFNEKAAVPAKFNMILRNNPTYSKLLQPEYAANIKQAYEYLRKLETGATEQMLSEIPPLDTSRWSAVQNIAHYTDCELFQVIIESQIKAVGGADDSPQAEQIFAGLNNMFTTVMGESDEALTKSEILRKISWFYATRLDKSIRGDCGIDPMEWEEFKKQSNSLKNDINYLSIKYSKGEVSFDNFDKFRNEYISKYKNSPYSADKMIDLIQDINIGYEPANTDWSIRRDSKIEKASKLGVRFLYCDNNKSAIFTLNVDCSTLELDKIGLRVPHESFTALYIVHNGRVVWARPLFASSDYRLRFGINFNNINRYNHMCTFALKEGDMVVMGGKQIIGGIELGNDVIGPVILKAAGTLSKGTVDRLGMMPSYDNNNSAECSESPLLARVKSSLFPIAGKSKSGKFFTQLVYDVFMQRFYEIEACNDGDRQFSSDLGKHIQLNSFISLRILRVWNLSQIDEIPNEYFNILRISENNANVDFSDGKYSAKAYERFRMDNSEFNMEALLNNASLYTVDDTQKKMLLDVADRLSDRLDNAKPTTKMFNMLEKIGLVASFKTKPSSFCHKTSYETVSNKQLDVDTALRELKIRSSYCTGNTPDSIIDTGYLKNSSQKILIDGTKEDVIFSNYVYYHDEPGRYTDKLRTFYTSVQSLENVIKLLKLIGESRASGLKGLGGLSNDLDRSIVTMQQIVPFYCPKGMKFKMDPDTKHIISNKMYNYNSSEYDNYIEYKVGIGIDTGNADVYSIALYGNSVIVLFRHDDLKSAALFQALTIHDSRWALMAYAISHGLDINAGGELFAIREMIIKGYNSKIPFVTDVIQEFISADIRLVQSLESNFDTRLLDLLTKQMRQ